MKKITKLIVGVLFILVLSCKKETTNPTNNTISIYGKWTVDKMKALFWQISGTPEYDSTLLGTGNYIEFRNNGFAYSETITTYNGPVIRIKPKRDTLNFLLNGDTVLLSKKGSNPDTLFIIQQTTTNLNTFSRYNLGFGKSEVWYFMSK